MTDRVTQIRSILSAYPAKSGPKYAIPPEPLINLELLSPMGFKILKDFLYRWPEMRNPVTYLSFAWRLMEKMLDEDNEYLDAVSLVLQRRASITTTDDFTAAMNAVDHRIKKNRQRSSTRRNSYCSNKYMRDNNFYQPIRSACAHGTMSASYTI